MCTVVAAVSCSSQPAATRLPEEDSSIHIASPSETGAPSESADEEYSALEVEGVRGGRHRFQVDGRVDDVVGMLLDFDHAQGHRAWAREYRTISREAPRITASWSFEGKLGINPEVVLELIERRESGVAVIEFRLIEKAFGLAAFFGDYRVSEDSANPARSWLVQRVFIDSGIWLANATAEDIENGLREDAKLIQEWMTLRLKDSSP